MTITNEQPKELTVENLINLIYQWGIDRNITPKGGATATSQISKAAEELVELIIAINSHNLEGVKDGVGDFLVCLAQAYRIAGHDAALVALVIENAQAEIPEKGKALELINAELINMVEPAYFEHMKLESLLKIMQLLKSCVYTWEIKDGLEHAWNEIKDRKGTMIDGKFVKES